MGALVSDPPHPTPPHLTPPLQKSGYVVRPRIFRFSVLTNLTARTLHGVVNLAPPVGVVNLAPPVGVVDLAPPVGVVNLASPVGVVNLASPVGVVNLASLVGVVNLAIIDVKAGNSWTNYVHRARFYRCDADGALKT